MEENPDRFIWNPDPIRSLSRSRNDPPSGAPGSPLPPSPPGSTTQCPNVTLFRWLQRTFCLPQTFQRLEHPSSLLSWAGIDDLPFITSLKAHSRQHSNYQTVRYPLFLLTSSFLIFRFCRRYEWVCNLSRLTRSNQAAIDPLLPVRDLKDIS